MRIGIAQVWQESNTFNPIPTTRQDFEDFGVLRGRELVEQMAETNELGGFIQSLRKWPEKPEVIGLVRLPAWPGGAATRETGTWLIDEIKESLTAALPLDGLLLALHGSLVADREPDVEGAILETVRSIAGSVVPVVATLDLHANVTERMVRNSDALVLYHTIPHTDVFETGVRGAAVLRRILIDGAKPVTAFRKVPMVVPAERANTRNPESVSYGFARKLQELEANSAIIAAGLAIVQPWLDIPDMGCAAVVVTDNDSSLAESASSELATSLWSARREYLPVLTDVQEAVRWAADNPEGLTVLSDSADATTSGAPGDSNFVLLELLKYSWQRPALVPMVAPELVKQAQETTPGVGFEAFVGGLRSSHLFQPRHLTGTVDRLFDARFILSGHLGTNLSIDMGPSAVLCFGNVHILATTRSGPHFAPEFFQSAGIDPFTASVLVAKSPCGFRAAYEGRASKIFVIRAPGCSPSDFWNYPYHNIPRPMWPWDEIDDPHLSH